MCWKDMTALPLPERYTVGIFRSLRPLSAETTTPNGILFMNKRKNAKVFVGGSTDIGLGGAEGLLGDRRCLMFPWRGPSPKSHAQCRAHRSQNWPPTSNWTTQWLSNVAVLAC